MFRAMDFQRNGSDLSRKPLVNSTHEANSNAWIVYAGIVKSFPLIGEEDAMTESDTTKHINQP